MTTNSFSVQRQPTNLWANQHGWRNYDPDLEIFTLDSGPIPIRAVPSFQMELIDMLRPSNTNLRLLIKDRWSTGILKNFGATEQSPIGAFSEISRATEQAEELFRTEWPNLYFIAIYGGGGLQPAVLQQVVDEFEKETLGSRLPPSIRAVLFSGHDNTFLQFVGSAGLGIRLTALAATLQRLGRPLNFVDHTGK